MADKISAIMATELALETGPAERSLKNLKQSVDIVNRAVKAQSDNYRAAGDEMNAMKSRAEGLSDVLAKQRAYVQRLESQQAHQVEIARNQASVVSDLKDKISDLQAKRREEVAENGRQSQSYKALTEDIKQYQAQLRDAQNIDRRLNSTTRQLENARAKLARFTQEQKDANTAINDMNPSMFTRLKTSINSATDAMAKSKAQSSSLKETMMGTFAGQTLSNAASAAWGTIKQGITGAVGAGIKFNVEQEKMIATWTTLTSSASQGKDMVDTIQQLATKTGQATDVVDELEQGFYHLHSNKKEADDMTKAMLNMADAVGLSGDQIQQVSQDMVHGMATGKITQGELNQIGMYFPMIDEAMAKHFHTSVAGMRQMAKQGKISAQALEEVMESLGSGKYDKAAENMMSTTYGAFRTLKAQIPKLLGEATQPLMKAQSPVTQAISKWSTDTQTQTEFQNLGKSVNTGMNTVMNAFSPRGGTNAITDALNNKVNQLGQSIVRFSNLIAQHAATIKAAFAMIQTAGHLAFQMLGAAIKSVIAILASFASMLTGTNSKSSSMTSQLNSLTTSMRRLSQNRAAIRALGAALAALFITSKAIAFTRSIAGLAGVLAGPLVRGFSRAAVAAQNGAGAMRVLSAALNTNPFVLVASAIAAVVVALVALYKHNQKFRDFCRGLLDSAKWLATRFIKAMPLYWLINAFVKLYKHNAKFRSFVNTILDSTKKLAEGIVKILERPFKWAVSLFKLAGKAYDAIASKGKQDRTGNSRAHYASGTTGTNEDQIALVNDASSPHYREMMLYNNNLYAFSKRRNQLAYIPKGAQVIDGETSKKIADRKGLNHFASGSSPADLLASNLNMAGGESRAVKSNEFLQKLNEQFNKYLAKFQQHIQKAMQTLHTSQAKANQMFAQTQSRANERLKTSQANAKKSQQEKIQRAQQRQAEAKQKAEQRLQERLAKAKQSHDERYQKAEESFQKREAKMAAAYNKKVNSPKATAKTVLRAQAAYSSSDAKALYSLQQSRQKADASLSKTQSTAQSSYQKSIETANNSASKTIANANTAFSTAMQNAANSHAKTIQNATVSRNQKLINAENTMQKTTSLANQNIARLKQWRQSNLSQLQQGMSQFANGGIADRPSVFGEAGLEAAIPLDAMQQGNAWQLLQKVVNFYAGNSAQNQSASVVNDDDHSNERQIEQINNQRQIINLLTQLVTGQSAQTQAVKGINGYDQNRAFDDFSRNFHNAQFGNLTY